MPKRSGLCLILFTFLLAGCASPQPTLLDPPNGSAALSPVITAPAAPVSAHTRTPLPAATATTILTATVTPTPTPTLIAIAPGSPVVVPVLLFHHIAANISDIRYFVAPDDFRIQMETLKQLGYTAIPMSKLVDVIKNGGELPARPVVITFDDGTEDVYQNAFPIMKEMDMTGALYIVANRLGIKDFLSVAEIKEMIASGWEVGSHSMSHPDLREAKSLSAEMYNSRLKLSDALGVPVLTFAYPFGGTDEFINRKAKTYGYDAAMGLGKSYTHTAATLFYISRLEIRHSTTLENFLELLPWKTPLK